MKKENVLVFKEKDCPFCYGFTDDRDNLHNKKCDHTFTELDYNAAVWSVYEMTLELKKNKKIKK